ncbi:pitrilysin family protein [Methyloceanibacter sp.]|uniref:M16 family metallopeptidase n=1 Tax=Methyloceanibacter sp. TaxID=1965321 RepID=UPI002D5C86F1|nr:pitrilysin family protein [Methyloceanibacter sp.]HZP10458.1 pitrilysin family protein [Methyloceanibacter sp.]
MVRRGAFGLVWLCALLVPLATAPAAQANDMKIERVTSPGGIEAWLVESHANPLIAIRFAFRGGATQDDPGKEGLSYFVSAMMDEGAGELDALAFQEKQQELAMRMEFDAARDVMLGNLQTLTENKDQVFDLVRLALAEPRFDEDAIARVRAQILAGLKFDEHDPETVASLAWDRLAFQGHPYGRPIKGTPRSVASITRDDLKSYVRRVFARDKLLISVVGDINPAQLGKALDHMFGALPAKADLTPVADAAPPLGPTQEIIEMDVPQSVAQFGHRGIPRKDSDFIAAYVLNYIIGGGGFASRLMEEVREKRGLAYSVYSNLYPYQHGAVFVGSVATKNEAVGQSLEVIEGELKRLAEQGPTAEELANAKSYLTGAYALRFESSSSIANQLLAIQIEDLGIDYVNRRNQLVEAVTLDDIKRVAKRLIEADRLITTIVGKPVAVAPVGTPG